MPPFAPRAPIDLPQKERIRVAYYDEALPMADVEEVAGVARSTLYRWFHAWQWPLRKPMRSRPRRRQDGPVFGGGERPATREPLKLRLTRLVEHRIAVLEHEAMAGMAVDPDANARAIALNARTLVTIERLAGEGLCPNCDGEPARPLTELRDELRNNLQRLRIEGRIRRGLPIDDDDAEQYAALQGRTPDGDR